jgi:predicted CoA-binding protein
MDSRIDLCQLSEGREIFVRIREAADQFLASRRIAVTGVSRKPEGHGSNIVYQRLKERGYQAFAVNPNTPTVDGDQAYPNLSAIPDGVEEAVVIGTSPEHAVATMREAVDLGIRKVWMHRSFGGGSVSPEATEYGRTHGVTVIDGGCPLMFGPTADGGHKVMCRVFTLTGKVPRRV